MESVISNGLRQESENTKAKYSDTSHWDRMLQGPNYDPSTRVTKKGGIRKPYYD